MFGLISPKYQQIGDIEAVSYTHLDVYKRQAVYVENGGWGATYGVPIGALMMEQYMKGKLSPENELRAEEISNRIILYGNEER